MTVLPVVGTLATSRALVGAITIGTSAMAPPKDEENAAASAADADSAASDDFFVESPDDDRNDEESSAPRPAPKSLKDHTRREYIFVLITGLALAFSAGYTNGVCLSGFIHPNDRDVKTSVAGVTGLYTGSAINLAEGDYDKLALAVGTIFSVMGGSFISGLLNPHAIAFSIGPRYGPTFVLSSIFMTLGAIAALHNSRREFYWTAMANGIQNGITSMYSANLIRTTHLTGTTTDIGLFIGMAIRGNKTNNWKLYILLSLATAFWVGSLTGYYASRAKRQYSLIFNAGFLFAIGASVILYFVKVHSISFCQAMFGLKLSEWNRHIDIIRRETDDEKVDETELMALFDELEDNDTGHVSQDRLLEAISSHDMSIKRRRKDLIGILHSIVVAHDDDGDWVLSKDDWRRLVHERSQSAIVGVRDDGCHPGGSNTRASLPPSAYSTLGGGPSALRSMSIAQVKSRAGRSTAGNRSSVNF